MIITDGRGKGYAAGIDTTNRLEVHSASISEERLAAVSGLAFAFSSGLVAFTAATDSALLFIKNTSERPMVLDRMRVMLGTVTGGTGDWILRILRNPTTGTIVTNALEASTRNVNYGSSITPTGVFYRGVQGDTLTDGTGAPFPLKSAGEGQLTFDIDSVLPTGASVGIRLQPPTGTTAAQATLNLRAYYPVAG